MWSWSCFVLAASARELKMARYKFVDMSPRLLPVVLEDQWVPGSIAHAVHHLVDALDLSGFDAHYRNDANGTQHLLANEPTGNSTYLTHFAIVIGPGDRPIVMYALNSASGSLQRYARCNDSACTAANVSSIGTNQIYYANPLALRSDGRPAFIEAGLNNNYAVCDNADCTGLARFPIGISGVVRSLVLHSDDRPAYESGTTGLASITVCDDATCSSAQQRNVLTDPNPQSGYQGSIALASNGALLVAFEEQSLRDVVLAVPLPDALFASGFE